MKTFITSILLGCALLSNTLVKAQVKSPLSFGVKAGLSLATTNYEDYEMKTGFVGGVVVDYDLSKNFFLRSGLDFVMKGAKLNLDGRTSADNNEVKALIEYKDRIQLNYLQVPFTVGYRNEIGNGISAFINAGPYIAYGIYGKGKYTTETMPVVGSSMSYKYDVNKSDSFDELGLKKFDFGILGSIGVEYAHCFVSVCYEYGLTNIAKKTTNKNQVWQKENSSFHNMNATCTLGYKF